MYQWSEKADIRPVDRSELVSLMEPLSFGESTGYRGPIIEFGFRTRTQIGRTFAAVWLEAWWLRLRILCDQ